MLAQLAKAFKGHVLFDVRDAAQQQQVGKAAVSIYAEHDIYILASYLPHPGADAGNSPVFVSLPPPRNCCGTHANLC